MNIGIITHYDVHNHGAVLQLDALISYLSKEGHHVQALRFDKNYDFWGHRLKNKYNISINSLPIYLNYIKENGLTKTIYNIKKRRVLESFKRRNKLLGSFYSETAMLDAVIIGSDEVFALHTGPTPAFFGYCLPSNNIISYAGSFGPTTLEDIDKLHSVNFVKSGLEGMQAITVRDQNSAEIVEALTGKRPPIVVDPVLLYGFNEEIKDLIPQISEKYLLIYSYDNRMNSHREIETIKEYAKKRGLKIISAGFFHKWCDKNINVNPLELLGWFRYASEVITDTFHGCVMSIITNTNFAVKTRETNHLKLTNLLKEYNLTERIFTEWDIKRIAEIFSSSIDYNLVNSEVELRRSLSTKLLKEMLN